MTPLARSALLGLPLALVMALATGPALHPDPGARAAMGPLSAETPVAEDLGAALPGLDTDAPSGDGPGVMAPGTGAGRTAPPSGPGGPSAGDGRQALLRVAQGLRPEVA